MAVAAASQTRHGGGGRRHRRIAGARKRQPGDVRALRNGEELPLRNLDDFWLGSPLENVLGITSLQSMPAPSEIDAR